MGHVEPVSSMGLRPWGRMKLCPHKPCSEAVLTVSPSSVEWGAAARDGIFNCCMEVVVLEALLGSDLYLRLVIVSGFVCTHMQGAILRVTLVTPMTLGLHSILLPAQGCRCQLETSGTTAPLWTNGRFWMVIQGSPISLQSVVGLQMQQVLGWGLVLKETAHTCWIKRVLTTQFWLWALTSECNPDVRWKPTVSLSCCGSSNGHNTVWGPSCNPHGNFCWWENILLDQGPAVRELLWRWLFSPSPEALTFSFDATKIITGAAESAHAARHRVRGWNAFTAVRLWLICYCSSSRGWFRDINITGIQTS